MWDAFQWIAVALAFASIALNALSEKLRTKEKRDDESTSSRDSEQS